MPHWGEEKYYIEECGRAASENWIPRNAAPHWGHEPRGLETDVLDNALEAIDGDEVPDDEGLVDVQRDGREEISEHALGGECDGHAADAHAGEHGASAEAYEVEGDDQAKESDPRPRDGVESREER